MYLKILRKKRFLVLQLNFGMFELMTHFVFLSILVWIDSYRWLKKHRSRILNFFFVNLVLYIFLCSLRRLLRVLYLYGLFVFDV